MKPNTSIEINALVDMLEAESNSERDHYFSELNSPLSELCKSSDALGPLIIKELGAKNKIRLTGSIYYSRFRPGDRVEIRIKKLNSDYSEKYSYNWVVEEVVYPLPGTLEIVISGDAVIEIDKKKEYFLFSSLSIHFNKILIKKIADMEFSKDEIILGSDVYNLAYQDAKYKQHYRNLNLSQKMALDYVVDHNMSGAIQGPPGTGKTQILQAVISLALQSNMKVCVSAFTNAAVDNLIGRIVSKDFENDWVRVGNPEKVRSELYLKDIALNNFVASSFNQRVIEANLFGATLHKLAFNSNAPKVDLLLIDEAGQVPIYFWPFIQRLAKRVILVGDHFQLPPVLREDHPSLPFDNLFSLLINNDTPMLETQYRMRREIQAWSSEKFYKGKLVPHHSVADRDYYRGNNTFQGDNFVAPVKFESLGSGSSSLNEANYITDKIEKLLRSSVDLKTVGVICPYRFQAGVVNASLQNRLGVNDASKVMIDTVERFQGQEKEAIFLSFGISGENQEQLNFLSDPKRLNVSVTRAKSRFYCLFDSNLLGRSRKSKSEELIDFLGWVNDGKISATRIA
ncbi:MAG: AAA family ATPase [Bdellovibrionaceae bacterium]|nr:AAA family ATPase [Pseudobdellovibrionaceae bacterium]